MAIPQLATLTKNVGKFLSDNSPTILTAIGVAGSVSTSILAVKATPRALQYIWEAESEFIEPLTPLDKIKLSWTCYIPALSVGAVTIACIICANSVNNKRNAALASVYSITETAFKEYQEKVVETVGKNKEQAVRDEVAKDQIQNNPPSNNQVIVTGGGDVLCYDTLSGRYFNSSVDKIRKAENQINAQLINEMYASTNDFYSAVGLPHTRMGEEVGWRLDNGMLELEFSSVLSEEDKPCLSVNYKVAPIREYYKLG